MNEVLDGTNTRGPNYGAGATPSDKSHVRMAAIVQPSATLFLGERATRVETLSIGTVDTDRHWGQFVHFLFFDGHVARYDGTGANHVSDGSSTPGDFWKTHDDELIWGAFR